MSRLQKAISRIQRREPARGIGFGAQSRERPRATLLGVLVDSAKSAKAALDAGADVVIIRPTGGKGAATEVKAAVESAGNGVAVGAWLAEIDDAAGEALADAGCDFVVGTLEGTAATAIDTDRIGQVLVAPGDVDDTTLRALAPLGIDALLVENGPGPMSLASQIKLVRLASFASTPLLVTVTLDASVAELRVLRDSGAGCVLLPEGASVDGLKAISDRLRAVPARKSRREGSDIALVPSMPSGGHDEHEEDEPPGEPE